MTVDILTRAAGLIRTGHAVEAFKRLLPGKRRWPAPPILGRPVPLPFAGRQEHRCFACWADNPIGLKLRFHEAAGWTLACSWTAVSGYENYPGMVHGGILATVVDEIIGQAVFHQAGHLPVSVNASIKWHRPVKIGELVVAAARIIGHYDRLYRAVGYIFRGDGKVAASADGRYYTPPLSQFRKMAGLEAVPPEIEPWFAPERPKLRS